MSVLWAGRPFRADLSGVDLLAEAFGDRRMPNAHAADCAGAKRCQRRFVQYRQGYACLNIIGLVAKSGTASVYFYCS